MPSRSAPALWLSSVNPSVVILETTVPLTLAAWPGLAGWPEIRARRSLTDGLHCVLGDTGGPHHIWLRPGRADRAPATIIPRDKDASSRHLAAWRLDCRLAGRASPRGSATLVPTRFQHQRLTLLLAILDRLEASRDNVSTHSIASALIYPRRSLPRGTLWKASNERRRTRRLVDEAFALREGGYRDLFRWGAEPWEREGGQK